MKWIHHFDEVASTNDELKRLAQNGAPSGTAVVADAQTAGRGRHGRQWFGPKSGNLHLSYLHRSFLEPTKLSALTLDAAVAAATAIEDVAAVEVELKWPNDLVVGGLKLGGILTELHPGLTADGTVAVIVGLGLNVNIEVDALPAELQHKSTTLSALSGGPVDLSLLMATTVRRLREKLAGYELEGKPDLVAYNKRFPYIGHGVTAAEREGVITDVLSDGALEVKWDNEPAPIAVRSGEVLLTGSAS